MSGSSSSKELVLVASGVVIGIVGTWIYANSFSTSEKNPVVIAGSTPFLRVKTAIRQVTNHGWPRAAKRVAGVIRLKPDMFNVYTQLHDRVWQEVMEKMYNANMRNFVIYHHKETNLLFNHFEYVGTDYEADMAKLAKDPQIQRWWSYCEPCQEPFKWEGLPPSKGGTGGPEGNTWWAPMTCVNHCGAWPIAWAHQFPDPDFVPNNPERRTSSSFHPL